MLVYVLALWLRCEACVQSPPHVVGGGVKENYELSQTVMNLSDQHRLLCEIRTTGLKTLRYSKDALGVLTCPSTPKRAVFGESFKSASSSASGSEAPDPLASTPETEAVLKGKAALRRGSASDSALYLLGSTR